jgi:hypothetical protein
MEIGQLLSEEELITIADIYLTGRNVEYSARRPDDVQRILHENSRGLPVANPELREQMGHAGIDEDGFLLNTVEQIGRRMEFIADDLEERLDSNRGAANARWFICAIRQRHAGPMLP